MNAKIFETGGSSLTSTFAGVKDKPPLDDFDRFAGLELDLAGPMEEIQTSTTKRRAGFSY